MFVVLSPAKTLDYTSAIPQVQSSLPRLMEQSESLNQILRGYDTAALARLMKVSDAIASLNVTRNQDWQPAFSADNARPALFAFKGDVYTGLQAERFSADEIEAAQTRLRILSGLYGLLRPLDLMQPYRLEMGTALSNPAGRDLYTFWGDTITDQLRQDMDQAGARVLVNLASQEYFRAVRPARLARRIVTPIFEDEKNGQYKVISFYAKKARGIMAAWILRENIKDVAGLEAFAEAGYRYMPSLSQGDTLVFRRREADIS